MNILTQNISHGAYNRWLKNKDRFRSITAPPLDAVQIPTGTHGT